MLWQVATAPADLLSAPPAEQSGQHENSESDMEPDAIQALVHAAAAQVRQHVRICPWPIPDLTGSDLSVQHPQLAAERCLD